MSTPQVFLKKFFDLSEKTNKIVITTHLSPDDDAIGSLMALTQILKEKYPKKEILPLATGNPSARYLSFLYFTQIQFVNDISDHLNPSDLLIFLDGSQFARFSKIPDKLSKFTGTTVCIDHHKSPVDSFTLSYVDPSYSSASEIVFILFKKYFKLTPDLSESFLLGILGDTGTFNYLKPNQLYTFDTVKTLLQANPIEIQEFKSRYDTIPLTAYKITIELIKNTQFIDIPHWPGLMVSHISRRFVLKNHYTESEISEAVHIFTAHYLRLITGYPWGMIFSPTGEGNCKLSLRSLPKSVNVRVLTEMLEIGGGHDRASGGLIRPIKGKTIDSRAAINFVLSWIKQNKPTLS